MKKIILSVVLFICFTVSLFAQSIQPFQEGDRAVFLGNSITDGGHYHSYIWLYYMTRFPNMNLRVLNAGIGGDTAHDMYKRLDGDVFSKQPSVLMVTFGMNDSGYHEYNGDNSTHFGNEKYDACYKNYQLMEKRLLGLENTRIVLMGSSPYDETAKIEGNVAFRGKNAVMERIVDFQRESANKNSWEFTDLNQPMTAINKQFQQKDPTFTICGKDRIHPDNDGHMIMAYLFLKAQGFSGKEVANIEINAANISVVNSQNCEISDVKKSGRDLSFDYLAESLPYPVDTIARGWGAERSQSKALDVVPFMEEMNKEMLTVNGLKGKYKLLIDDEEVGTWTGDQLAKGINLAKESKTPQYQQALAIMYLNETRWEIERNFRDYAWMQFGFMQPKGLLFANNRAAIEAIDKHKSENIWAGIHRETFAKMMHPAVREAREQEMEVLINKIYEINKPVKRRVVLRKM